MIKVSQRTARLIMERLIMKNPRYKRHAYSNSPRRGGYWEWDKMQHRPGRVEARLEEAEGLLAYLRAQDATRRRRPSGWPNGGAVSWVALTHIGEGGENPRRAVLKTVEERRKWFNGHRGVDPYHLDKLVAELGNKRRRGGHTPEESLRLE
jgi:hypothetical protein